MNTPEFSPAFSATAAIDNTQSNAATDISAMVKLQRASFLKDGFPSAKIRHDRLDRTIDLLKTNKQVLCDALSDDYGSRSYFESLCFDIYVTLESLKYCRKNTAKWMKPENRGAKFPLNLLGAKAQAFYQPLGVVGIVSPWNFPIQLAFSPLANALSAGNRALIKPSELTPATAELMQQLISASFDPSEIAVVNGDADVAVSFTQQKFDHLVFTGAPSVAKHVMRAAAENLVPLTLELGGKCPVIVGSEADLKSSVERIMTFKTINAGQICLAPDYVFVRESMMDAFIQECRDFVSNGLGKIADNPEYTAVVNARHHSRINGYLEDARARNVEIIPLGSEQSDCAKGATHRIAPTLVINPPLDSKIMTEEIFGPAMPIVSYTDINQAIQHINQGERPLALYYFGKSKSDISHLKHNTTSGGMVVNDIAAHVLQDTMPLGGVGNSGMGSYHGFDGFRQLSHMKAFYKQGLLSLTPYFKAPRSKTIVNTIDKLTS